MYPRVEIELTDEEKVFLRCAEDCETLAMLFKLLLQSTSNQKRMKSETI